jgi:aminopeptidase N
MLVSLQRLGLAVGLSVLASAPCLAAPFSFDTTPGRLPKTVVARDYTIAIVPDIARRRFDGTERVALDVRSPVRTLRFDSLNERLTDVRFDGKRVASVASDDAAQLTTIRLAHTARRGAHVLTFAYTGRLETEPRGLFIQSYTRPDGRPGQLLSTQFESIDARRMFPGWDEPAFRASFTLSMTVPAAWATIGNMPVARRVVRGRLATTTFARTPPMASYLLEFTGGDLTALHGRSGPTAIAVWAVRGTANQGAYALASARTILADYDAYYGTPYPLPKLDLIAIPGGFPGAMENWGAITFEADELLTRGASIAERQTIFGDYLSHEMAHLWTGDLVTTAWWDDIWLNESFANWRSASETDARQPDWHWWENQDGDKEVAMDADARRSSHPIVQLHLDERMADAAFDGPITYSKGQAFLRMLEAYLTPDRFRDGIRRYLRAHAYANATSSDLYAALGAASGIDVARFARGWTEQPGFPLVSVRATCDDAGLRTIVLAQTRFLMSAGDGDADRERWEIPLHVRSGNGPETRLLLRDDGTRVAAGRCDEPLTVNAGATGFYRVAYDDATLALDTRAFATFPAADKIVLLDDQWALASSGAAPLASYLALVDAWHDDSGERGWVQVLGALDQIARAERGTAGESAYLAFARGVAQPLATRLGWDPQPGEPPADANLRRLVLERLGDWGDPATLAEARARFALLRTGSPRAAGDLRGVIVRLAARDADASTFDELCDLARSARDDDERARYYDALMRVRDPALAARALHLALSPEIPASLAGSRYGWVLAVADVLPAAAWTTFRAHASALLAPQGSTGPETAADSLPDAFWRGVPLPAIAAWLNANAPSERTIGIPRGIERAEDLMMQAPRLVAGADAYVAGSRSGTSARMSSSSGMASRNAPTTLGSKPKPASFSICSTAMLTDAASRQGRREVSAENVSATATTRANCGIATPWRPTG